MCHCQVYAIDVLGEVTSAGVLLRSFQVKFLFASNSTLLTSSTEMNNNSKHKIFAKRWEYGYSYSI